MYTFKTFKEWRYEFYLDSQGYTHYPEDDRDIEYNEEDREYELQTWAFFMLRGLYITQRKTWDVEIKDIRDGFFISYGWSYIGGPSREGWHIYQQYSEAGTEEWSNLHVGLFRFPTPVEADAFLQYEYNGVQTQELLLILYDIPRKFKVSPRATYGINDQSMLISTNRVDS